MKTLSGRNPAKAALLAAAMLATGSVSGAQSRFFTVDAGSDPAPRIVEDFDRDGPALQVPKVGRFNRRYHQVLVRLQRRGPCAQ